MNSWEVMYRCTVWCYVLYRWNMAWGQKAFLVPDCFGGQCFVASARGQQSKERVGSVWGVLSDFLRVDVIMCDGGAQELELLLCCCSAVHDGEWGWAEVHQ